MQSIPGAFLPSWTSRPRGRVGPSDRERPGDRLRAQSRWTPSRMGRLTCRVLAAAIALASSSLVASPAQSQTETTAATSSWSGELLWSGTMTVTDFGNAAGATTENSFSRISGRDEFRPKWLWYEPATRGVRLELWRTLHDIEGATLHLGDIELPLPDRRGDSSFRWDGIELTWQQGELVPVRLEKRLSVTFEATEYAAAEGGTSAVTILLSGNPGRETSIPIVAAPGGGAGPSDYEVDANVTFTKGGALSQTVVLTALDDAANDDDEYVVLGFGAMPGPWVTAGEPDTATVRIVDDDEELAITSPLAIEVSENETAVFTLSTNDGTTPPADLVWSLSGGVDAGKFSLTSAGVLTFKSAKDFEAPDDSDGNGVYALQVHVTNGTSAAQANLEIRLTDRRRDSTSG